MNSSLNKFLLQLILVFVNCHLTLTFKPAMQPNKSEIVINEGDPLVLTCRGNTLLQFIKPTGKDISPFYTEEDLDDDEYVLTLRRNKTVFGDTGWYGCAISSVTRVPNDTLPAGASHAQSVDYPTPYHYRDEVTWIYVYVKSDDHWFVTNQLFFHATVGDPGIISCRPTSPDYHVELFTFLFDDREKFNITPYGRYDPHLGFIINSVFYIDNLESFECEIQREEQEPQIIKILAGIEEATSTLPSPEINMELLPYVVQGQDFYLNCSVRQDISMKFHYTWFRGNTNLATINDPRIRIIEKEDNLGNGEKMNYRDLIIKNSSIIVDTGNYSCVTSARNKTNTETIEIKINDPNEKFLEIEAHSNQTDYKMSFESSVTWIINVSAYPIPEYIWYNPHGGAISHDENKYIVNATQRKASLTIKNLQTEDVGRYTFEAKGETNDGPKVEKLSFNLIVLCKPLIRPFVIEKYYQPNETTKISCLVAGFPPPDVFWYFQELSDDLSGNKSRVELKNFTNEIEYSFVKSTLNMQMQKPGTLLCLANNSLGSNLEEKLFFISEIPNGFGILEPSKDITVGDNVELICGASIYNYSDSLEWNCNDEPEESFLENSKYTITKVKTQFSYQSRLHINNIQKSENKNLYSCSAKSIDGKSLKNETRLDINDPAKPSFIYVNMNGSENTYEFEPARTTIITFKCHVSGMPPPQITWMKDDEIISPYKDLYTFANKNQELEIKYPLPKNSGKYSCTAKNRLGKIHAYHTLTINGANIPKLLIISIVVLLILCVILVIYFSIKMHREKVMRKQLMEAGLTHFEDGALECLNPDLTVDDQAELLPYDKKWEFPREKLKFGKQLGCGAFGVVMKAEAQGINENEALTIVAVKMVRRSTEPTYIRALASELKIMIYLGKHLNVVNLLGACTRNISKRELLVIVEYCQYGNLHNYLLRHRTNFINQIDPMTGKIDPTIGRELLTRSFSTESHNRLKYAALSFSHSISMNSNSGPDMVGCTSSNDSQGVNPSPDGIVLSNDSIQPGWRSNYCGDYKDQNLKPICTQDLLSWAFQVARGMEYLSQRKVLHGDLAARNILLSEDNVVKICDFGLAKTMYKDENYQKKGDAPLPIKWMAIESIRDRIFSTQSDVWSFGIVLWEFFTLAKTPYPGMEAEKQYQKLIEGYRMEQPEFATDEVYDIMLQCWKTKPSLRPSFTDLVQSIGNLLDESVKMHYVDLNTPYMDMNTMTFENGKNDYLTMMSAPVHETMFVERDYVNSPSIPMSPTSPMSSESSYLCMSPANPNNMKIFSPHGRETMHFNFPSPESNLTMNSDSESESVEQKPMLEHEDDNYLQPINVQERRAEFARKQKAIKNNTDNNKSTERDSGYCNTPLNSQNNDNHNDVIDGKENMNNKKINDDYDKKNTNNFTLGIIRTQDNYVNMPKYKNDLKKDTPDSFTNPSYVFMTNMENNDTRV